jgi:hypothetical protein
VAFVLLLPFVIAGVVAVIAVTFTRLSTLRITSAGVELRNYPQAARLIPLDQVGQFEETPKVGNFAFLRPKTAALVLKDGTRVPVRTVASPDAGIGVEALNERIASLRAP